MYRNFAKISIHAAREGGDSDASIALSAAGLTFQSTPPVKAATWRARCFYSIKLRISIHAAREGGDFASSPIKIDVWISIHAAREGGDNGDFMFFAVI